MQRTAVRWLFKQNAIIRDGQQNLLINKRELSKRNLTTVPYGIGKEVKGAGTGGYLQIKCKGVFFILMGAIWTLGNL